MMFYVNKKKTTIRKEKKMRLKKGKNQRINFKALLYRKLIKFFLSKFNGKMQ